MRVRADLLSYPPRRRNGAFITTHAFLAGMVERGHEVDVVTTGDHDPYELDGVRVNPSRGTPAYPDLLVNHRGYGDRVRSRPGRHGPRRLVLVHGMDRVPGGRTYADLAWFGTDATRREFERETGWRGASVVVPPPVDPARYRIPPEEACGADGTGAVTLVGLTRDKGVDLFYALAQRLPDIPFLGVRSAVGTQITASLGNVAYLSMTDDMREVYRRSRIVLMPSRHETYGRVGIEAMCSGIPVVAHPTPGMCEAYTRTDTIPSTCGATFIPRHDIDAWTEAVRDLYLDADSWREASARASAHAVGLDYAAAVGRFCEAAERLVDS